MESARTDFRMEEGWDQAKIATAQMHAWFAAEFNELNEMEDKQKKNFKRIWCQAGDRTLGAFGKKKIKRRNSHQSWGHKRAHMPCVRSAVILPTFVGPRQRSTDQV